MTTMSPICAAAACGDAEVLNALMATGHDPEGSDAEGWQPAHWAAAAGSFEGIHALQCKGVPLNTKTFSDLSPADVASDAGHTELAALIIDLVDRFAPVKRRAMSLG